MAASMASQARLPCVGPEPERERSDPWRRRALGGRGDAVAFLPARTNAHPHASKRMGPALQEFVRRLGKKWQTFLEKWQTSAPARMGRLQMAQPLAGMTKAQLGRTTPAAERSRM
jgi:hypothetical protein